MSADVEAAVRPELAAGERLLWTGRPNILRLAWLRGGMSALIAIPWTAFAVLWTFIARLFASAQSAQEGGNVFGQLSTVIGPVFILAGIVLFFTSLYRAISVRGTLYALTDRRAILITGGGARVRSFAADQLEQVERSGTRRGDIVFRNAVPYSLGDRYDHARNLTDFGFFGIADPRGVERLIREQIAKP